MVRSSFFRSIVIRIQLTVEGKLMRPGSLADISRYAFPDGFDENVIATVLQQTLQGLLYLHQNGWLHRDIKAANLLVDGTLSSRTHFSFLSLMTVTFR